MEKRVVIEPCSGCNRVEDDGFCTVYAWPEVQWRPGRGCPMATHRDRSAKESKFVDPLKASKRKMKKR